MSSSISFRLCPLKALEKTCMGGAPSSDVVLPHTINRKAHQSQAPRTSFGRSRFDCAKIAPWRVQVLDVNTNPVLMLPLRFRRNRARVTASFPCTLSSRLLTFSLEGNLNKVRIGRELTVPVTLLTSNSESSSRLSNKYHNVLPTLETYLLRRGSIMHYM